MKKLYFSFLFSFLFFSICDAQSQEFKISEKNKNDTNKWTFHFQFTSIYQYHPAFYSLYSGENSLSSNEENAVSLTSTFFLGRKLWKGAALYFNPEIAGGKGLSGALGTGGPFNGETFRIGDPSPTPYIARIYFHQQFALGKTEYEECDGGKNQLCENIPESRIVISAGKFCMADFFDDNKFSHDPRTQFMNWSLMNNAAWDYTANTRGYTWGLVVEFIKPKWSARVSEALVPLRANSMLYDLDIANAHSTMLEVTKKISLKNKNGKIRLMAFQNISKAPVYRDAINKMQSGDSSLITIISGNANGITNGGIKYGIGLSFDQEIFPGVAIFGRAGWNDGKTATWAYTEVDETASIGLNIDGEKFKRNDDNFAVAFATNGISNPHRDYLNSGGSGFILGDGRLSNYSSEQIFETFYNCKLATSLWLSVGYQYMINPGYNKDRGPVNVFSVRAHVEF